MSNEEKLELAKELEQYTKEEMIEKFIDELEENCTLSDLWCKSQNIIKEVREYIENNNLYEQDYTYDYEENIEEWPPDDTNVRKELLEILDKEKDNE